MQPKNYKIDNECSQQLFNAFEKHNVAFQKDRPYLHQSNAAERAICTVKHNIKAVLASLDPDYPAREWDCLLPQMELTLNLLQASRINPRLSAYANMNGNFDYNRTSLVPMGTKVVAHVKVNARQT